MNNEPKPVSSFPGGAVIAPEDDGPKTAEYYTIHAACFARTPLHAASLPASAQEVYVETQHAFVCDILNEAMAQPGPMEPELAEAIEQLEVARAELRELLP